MVGPTIVWAHRRAPLHAFHQPNLVGGEVVQAVDQLVNVALQIARVGVRIAPLPRQNLIHQRLYLRHKGLVFRGEGRDGNLSQRFL
jgi:hypothetical protein